MVLMSGADLPLRAIREQVVSAIDLVVFVERMQDGTRKVTQISEVRGLESDVVTMQDIFAFDTRGPVDRLHSELKPTGIRPGFTDQLAGRGIELPAAWFGYVEHTKDVRP
jgi:pilus assembly protein CpaF